MFGYSAVSCPRMILCLVTVHSHLCRDCGMLIDLVPEIVKVCGAHRRLSEFTGGGRKLIGVFRALMAVLPEVSGASGR